MPSLQSRRQRYSRCSSAIAGLDDRALLGLLDQGMAPGGGWGRHQTVAIAGTKVFVKRIPLTELELEHPWSTANLFALPTYYNYGVGSAGFGAYRELVAHIRTTNWVLSGACPGFPLLYHHRVLPFAGTRPAPDPQRHERHVAYWGGSAEVGRYLLDRAQAPCDLTLFLEHIPHTLAPWLVEHSEQTPRFLAELRRTIAFLGEHGILHFDAHGWNIVTDGRRPYLTDFGLVLDRHFALGPDEQRFWRRHRDYDYGELLLGMGMVVNIAVAALPEAQRAAALAPYGISEGMPHAERGRRLLDNLARLCADGVLGLRRPYVAVIERYRPVIALMDAFFAAMAGNDHKDTAFPAAELRQGLVATGFLPARGAGGR